LLRDKEFGLSAYTQRGELPEATKLVELVLEVETTTYLSELLFSSGISELISVTVLKPEEDTSAGRRRPADFPGVLPGTLPGRNRPGRGEAAEKPQDPAEEAQKAVQAEIDRLFEPMELELNFTVYEDLLWDVLNRLAADSNQFIVQSVSITNANENLWPQSITPPFRNERDADRTATRRQAPTAADLDLFGLLGEQSSEPSEEEQAAVPIPGLTERRQRVTGGELLDVSMRVAFYRLKPQAPATEEN
jgi:hypothetical protein